MARLIILLKAHVRSHVRRLSSGKLVTVRPYDTSTPSARPKMLVVRQEAMHGPSRGDLQLPLLFDSGELLDRTSESGESKHEPASLAQNSDMTKQTDTIRAALEAQIPDVASSIEHMLGAQYIALLDRFKGDDTFDRIASTSSYRVWSETIRRVCTRTESYKDPANPRPWEKVTHYTLNPDAVKRLALERATAAVGEWEGKIKAKAGELESAEVLHLNGPRFSIKGTRGGKVVHIEQDMIVNVSSKGTLFNQFPARIYVDGRFTSAAKYEAMFKGAPAPEPEAPAAPPVPALTPEQRNQIAKNDTLRVKHGSDGEGARGVWKAAARAGIYDHLWDEHVAIEKAADDAEKARKQAKNEAWREKNMPKLVAAKKARIQMEDERREADRREAERQAQIRETVRKRIAEEDATQAEAERRQDASYNVKPRRAGELPTTGRVSSDDPSIYGSWLLGHEGELWSRVRAMAPKMTAAQEQAAVGFITSRKLEQYKSVREENGMLYLSSPGALNMARALGMTVSSIGGGYSGAVVGGSKADFLAAADKFIADGSARVAADKAAHAAHQAAQGGGRIDKHEASAAGHAAGRVYLNVPFASKDGAKSAGARWDADARSWYWPGKASDIPAGLRKFYGGPMAGFSS